MTTIVPRSEWIGTLPGTGRPLKNVPAGRLHHVGGGQVGVPKDKGALLRSIEADVRNRGYSSIDYNLMVFQDGEIWEGRGLPYEDAATKNHNRDSVSVCAVGNFDLEPARDALCVGIAEAFRHAAESGWLHARAPIFPHSATFSTACPGKNLRARDADIAAVYLNGPLPKPPKPTRRKDMLVMEIVKRDSPDPRTYVDFGHVKRWIINEDELRTVWIPKFLRAGLDATTQKYHPDYIDRTPTMNPEPKWSKARGVYWD